VFFGKDACQPLHVIYQLGVAPTAQEANFQVEFAGLSP